MRVQIPDEQLRRVLEFYPPNVRYLTEMWVDWQEPPGKPSFGGIAIVRGSHDFMVDIPTVTLLDIQRCLYEAAHAAWSQWLPEGRIPEMNMSLNEYIQNMGRVAMGVKSNVTINKPICKGEYMSGSGEVYGIREHRGMYICMSNFEIEGGKAEGKAIFALKPLV